MTKYTDQQEYTERQVGKRVVAQRGAEIGTVSEVRDGALWVEVGPDADAETLDLLGWNGTVNQNRHHLRPQFISTITEETVRLNV